MNDTLLSQLPLIVALQNHTQLLPVMKFFTLLGNEEFFLLLLPLIYWCFDKRIGRRLGVLLLVGDSFNILLKVAFAAPRPYWLMAYIKPLATEKSFGFPSSHAQNAASVWPFLALGAKNKSRRMLCLIFAVLLVALIGLSRVYLGVHFPTDVLGGIIVGLLFLVWFRVVAPQWERVFAAKSLDSQLFWIIVLSLAPLVCFGLIGEPHRLEREREWVPVVEGIFKTIAPLSWNPIVSHSGALFGLLIGLVMASRSVPFEADGDFKTKIARFLIGAIGILILWRGLSLVLVSSNLLLDLVFRGLRYFLTTFWVVCGAPWVFGRLKLGCQVSKGQF